MPNYLEFLCADSLANSANITGVKTGENSPPTSHQVNEDESKPGRRVIREKTGLNQTMSYESLLLSRVLEVLISIK